MLSIFFPNIRNTVKFHVQALGLTGLVAVSMEGLMHGGELVYGRAYIQAVLALTWS